MPIDTVIFSSNHPLSIAWQMIAIFALSLSFYALKISNNIRLGFFFIRLVCLSLAPAYLLFIISPGLAGSRLAYLATIPLCLLLTYGIAHFSLGFKFSPIVRTLGGALLVASIMILYCNNVSYASAGHLSNRIISELQRYYGSVSGDPQVRVLGFPVIGNITGMTKIPFSERDTLNCDVLNAIVMNACEQSFPFGFLKESIAQKKSEINFLYWDKKTQTLQPVVLDSIIPEQMKSWQSYKLKSAINAIGSASTKLIWEYGNVLHIIQTKSVV